MPELIPPTQVHFQHRSGTVVTGWAMYYNPSTEVLEVEWTDPLGVRTVSYVDAHDLLPQAARFGLAEPVPEPVPVPVPVPVRKAG